MAFLMNLFNGSGWTGIPPQFQGDTVNGHGIQYSDTGKILYEGNWKGSKYHGQGKKYRYTGELLYEGEFQNGEYHGKGTLYFSGMTPGLHRDQDDKKLGRVYKGEFQNGKRHGTGTSYHLLRDQIITYVGSWKDDLKDGEGAIYNNGLYSDETKKDPRLMFQGTFVEGDNLDIFTGRTEGTMYYHDGSIKFEGTYNSAHTLWSPYAHGKWYQDDGSILIGGFTLGTAECCQRLDGQGAIQYLDGTIMKGNYMYSKIMNMYTISGPGTLISPEGQTFRTINGVPYGAPLIDEKNEE